MQIFRRNRRALPFTLDGFTVAEEGVPAE